MAPSWSHKLLIVSVMIVTTHVLYTYHIIGTITWRTDGTVQSPNDITLPRYQSPNDSIKLPKQNWKLIYWQKPRKTGGTSLFQLMLDNNRMFENVTRRRCHWNTRDRAFDTWNKIKKRCTRYHHKIVSVEYQPFFTSSYLKYKHEPLWNDVLLMTMLRDPISRVFSDLVYKNTWHCMGPLVPCLYQNHAKFTSNIYSKIFSGVWPYSNPNGQLIQHNVDFNANMTIDELQFGLAKLVLHDFDVILLLEMWEHTSVQLRCYGMNNITLPHANVGEGKRKLADFPEVKQHIIELNEYDIKLYAYAKQLALEKTELCNQYLQRNDASA